MEGNATRGMLGGGPASQHPRMQSQQIRDALPRTVTPVSLRYPQLLSVLMRIPPARCGQRRRERCARAAIAPSGLTAPQCAGASCTDPEQPPATPRRRSSIQHHSVDCAAAGQVPLSVAAASCRPGNGDCHGWAVRQEGKWRYARSGFAMLNVPTLWTAFVINFLALGLVWAYVARSYPNFDSARLWTATALTAAAGVAVSMLHTVLDSRLTLVGGGTLVIAACCLAAMGIQRFYGQPATWRASAAITALSCAGLTFFMVVHDAMPMRILIFSLGQSIPILATLKLVLARRDGRENPGARLAGIVAILILLVHAARSGCALLQIGGEVSMLSYAGPQAALMLVQVFLSMAWNFGFLLMAIDRLRNEVADLALLDDLTGVGNRRFLLQRLTQECAGSERSGEPFALLVIDLDGFKAINDTHGHAAGDACLQHFTLMAQTRLRPGDMLARTGGDEFCVVLPDSTLREGAMIARRILDVCREDAEACVGNDIPIALSIGVAQWTREIGGFPDRLIAAADHALYVAKNEGKNRHAVYEPAPPLAPAYEAAVEQALRKLARAC